MENFTENELQEISKNMISYGGIFHKRIGEALMVANEEDTQELCSVFGELFRRFLRYSI